jgi:hypothetical protein
LNRFLAERPDWKSAGKAAEDSGASGGRGKAKKKKPDNRRR